MLALIALDNWNKTIWMLLLPFELLLSRFLLNASRTTNREETSNDAYTHGSAGGHFNIVHPSFLLSLSFSVCVYEKCVTRHFRVTQKVAHDGDHFASYRDDKRSDSRNALRESHTFLPAGRENKRGIKGCCASMRRGMMLYLDQGCCCWKMHGMDARWDGFCLACPSATQCRVIKKRTMYAKEWGCALETIAKKIKPWNFTPLSLTLCVGKNVYEDARNPFDLIFPLLFLSTQAYNPPYP